MIKKRNSIRDDDPLIQELRNSRKVNTNTMELEIHSIIEDMKKKMRQSVSCNQLLNIDNNTFKLILYILNKPNRNSNEMLIIKAQLNQFMNFINMLKGNKQSADFEELLTKISFQIKAEHIPKDNLIFKTGDKGNKFYIVLKGKVGILIPKDIRIKMSEEGYIKYLLTLRKYNEIEIFTRTIQVNRHIYTVNEYDFDNYVDELINYSPSKYKRHLSLSNKQIKGVINHQTSLNLVKVESHISIEEYIRNTTPVASTNENHPEVTIWTYHNVISLGQGETFGDIALHNANQKRTATVISIEESYLGVFTKEVYDTCIREAKEKLRKNNVSFLLNYKVFSNYNRENFDKKLFNSFFHFYIRRGEFLFSPNEHGKSIYFIKEGMFDIYMKKSFPEINLIISSLGCKVDKANDVKNECEYYNYKNFADKKHTFRIAIVTEKDLIGLEDYKYEGKYFCSAQCISSQAEVFGLDSKFFEMITENDSLMKLVVEKFLRQKKSLMIERLVKAKEVMTQNFLKYEVKNSDARKPPKKNEGKKNALQVSKRDMTKIKSSILRLNSARLFKDSAGTKKKSKHLITEGFFLKKPNPTISMFNLSHDIQSEQENIKLHSPRLTTNTINSLSRCDTKIIETNTFFSHSPRKPLKEDILTVSSLSKEKSLRLILSGRHSKRDGNLILKKAIVPKLISIESNPSHKRRIITEVINKTTSNHTQSTLPSPRERGVYDRLSDLLNVNLTKCNKSDHKVNVIDCLMIDRVIESYDASNLANGKTANIKRNLDERTRKMLMSKTRMIYSSYDLTRRNRFNSTIDK